MTYRKKKHLPTIRNIPDDLWDEIKLILPSEKLDKTVGRPVVPFRKVFEKLWIRLLQVYNDLRGI